jgi:hypothetical protein
LENSEDSKEIIQMEKEIRNNSDDPLKKLSHPG